MGVCASKPATREGGSRHKETHKKALDSSISTEGSRASASPEWLHDRVRDSVRENHQKLLNTSGPGAFNALNSTSSAPHPDLFPEHERTRSCNERHLNDRILNLNSAAKANTG